MLTVSVGPLRHLLWRGGHRPGEVHHLQRGGEKGASLFLVEAASVDAVAVDALLVLILLLLMLC